MTSTLLIDGDLVVYRACAGSQLTIAWDADAGITSTSGNPMVAYRIALANAGKAAQVTGCRDLVWCFSDSTNFRKSICDQYKANRKNTERPAALDATTALLRERFEGRTYTRPGLEADDILGIIATSGKIIKGRRVIYSMDKDLASVPGELWDGKTLRAITEAEADRFFFRQVLTGDSTDGYPGCPGIGPVRADKILDGVQDGQYWPVVLAAYQKAGLDEAAAIKQARLARILRNTDYCFKKKEPILWTA